MKLSIGHLDIELLAENPDYEALTSPQAITYQILLALFHIGKKHYSIEAVVRWLSLQSAAPLYVRINNLQKRGLLRIEEAAALQG